MDIEKYKKEITDIVESYIKQYPDEFLLIREELKEKRKAQIDKFSEVPNADYLERATYEIPETLFNMLTLKLSFGADQWWRTLDGSRWFAKTFKAFKIAELI